MNYQEAKKYIDEIRNEFACKGELIMRCAMQNVIEYGIGTLKTKHKLTTWLKEIDVKHDLAEKAGDILFIGREFEKEIARCTFKLAEAGSMNLIMYLQREMWMYNNPGEISYERAIELLRKVIDYKLGYMTVADVMYDLESIGFSDMELCELGFEDVFLN